MAVKINSNAVYGPSADIVAREIEAEIIIVPLVAGVGDAEGDLFSLNETGRAFWRLLDGKRTLDAIAAELEKNTIRRQAALERLAAALLKRRIFREQK